MASATEHLGTLLAFLFFTGLQVWPLVYLAWFVQTAVGDAGCSDLSSTAHLVAKIIVWLDVASVAIMFMAVIVWYGREKVRSVSDPPAARGAHQHGHLPAPRWQPSVASSDV